MTGRAPDPDLTVVVPTAPPLPSAWMRSPGHGVEVLTVDPETMLVEAAERARGNTILFLGADVVAGEETVREHLRVQREGPVVGIGPTGAPPLLGGDLLALCSLDNLSVPRQALLELVDTPCPTSAAAAAWIAHSLERRGVALAYIPTARVTRRESPLGAVRRITAEATAHLELVSAEPELLPRLPLGAFAQVTVRELLVRRAALAVRVPALAAFAVLRRRWAGAAHRYCYWRAVQRVVGERDTWRRLARGAVILLYHAISAQGERGGSYVVPARRFARQMWVLRLLRHPVLSVSDLLELRDAHRLPPPRSVAVTFDDGYADNRSVACPILRKYGFPATIFVVTGAIGGVNTWVAGGELRERALLSWDDLDALAQDGIEIGGHTESHRPMPSLAPEDAATEAASSRRAIEHRLRLAVQSFAYPHGAHDVAAEEAVKAAGYRGACTTKPGVNDPATPSYALRRADIRGNLSLLGFLLALWAGGPGIRRRWREGQ